MRGKQKELTCEDCDDEIEVGKRRIRCLDCGKRVCSFCYHHSLHRRFGPRPRGEGRK